MKIGLENHPMRKKMPKKPTWWQNCSHLETWNWSLIHGFWIESKISRIPWGKKSNQNLMFEEDVIGGTEDAVGCKQITSVGLPRWAEIRAGPGTRESLYWVVMFKIGVNWLTRLSNKIRITRKMPDDWRKSVVVPFYKNKGDIWNFANFRAIKLISHEMKL